MAVERILAISGQDDVQISRKYLPPWNGRLPARIMLVSNETPSLPDSSRALPGRMIAFRFVQSWLGREDTELKGNLESELPGILLWAIQGWVALKRDGKLSQPDGGQSIIDEMSALGSPIGSFVEQKCHIHPDASVDTSALFRE